MTINGLMFKTKSGFKPLTWENAKEDSKILKASNCYSFITQSYISLIKVAYLKK